MKKILLIVLVLLMSTASFAQQRRGQVLSREEALNRQYTSGLFSHTDATYFDLEHDNSALGAQSYLNVLDWLQGRVAGLQVYTIRSNRVPFIRNSPAAIFVDEMRVDAAFLDVLPVQDIAMIKVMKGASAHLLGAGGGVVAIYTKTGEEEEIE